MNTPRKDQNDRMPPDGATIEEQDWDALDAGDAKPVGQRRSEESQKGGW